MKNSTFLIELFGLNLQPTACPLRFYINFVLQSAIGCASMQFFRAEIMETPFEGVSSWCFWCIGTLKLATRLHGKDWSFKRRRVLRISNFSAQFSQISEKGREKRVTDFRLDPNNTFPGVPRCTLCFSW